MSLFVQNYQYQVEITASCPNAIRINRSAVCLRILQIEISHAFCAMFDKPLDSKAEDELTLDEVVQQERKDMDGKEENDTQKVKAGMDHEQLNLHVATTVETAFEVDSVGAIAGPESNEIKNDATTDEAAYESLLTEAQSELATAVEEDEGEAEGDDSNDMSNLGASVTVSTSNAETTSTTYRRSGRAKVLPVRLRQSYILN